MTASIILITGGARSGKSSYAEKIAAEMGEQVLYLATAQAWDDEMRARIHQHRLDRPDHWETVECPTGVAATLSPRDALPSVVLLDCVTLLVSNVVLSLPEPWTDAQQAANREIDALIALAQQSDSTFILVTNEVGLGIVPDNKLARIYRDVLGRVNQSLATHADRVLFMVSGLPMIVKGQ